jgi:hypothetical protein
MMAEIPPLYRTGYLGAPDFSPLTPAWVLAVRFHRKRNSILVWGAFPTGERAFAQRFRGCVFGREVVILTKLRAGIFFSDCRLQSGVACASLQKLLL